MRYTNNKSQNNCPVYAPLQRAIQGCRRRPFVLRLTVHRSRLITFSRSASSLIFNKLGQVDSLVKNHQNAVNNFTWKKNNFITFESIHDWRKFFWRHHYLKTLIVKLLILSVSSSRNTMNEKFHQKDARHPDIFYMNRCKSLWHSQTHSHHHLQLPVSNFTPILTSSKRNASPSKSYSHAPESPDDARSDDRANIIFPSCARSRGRLMISCASVN